MLSGGQKQRITPSHIGPPSGAPHWKPTSPLTTLSKASAMLIMQKLGLYWRDEYDHRYKMTFAREVADFLAILYLTEVLVDTTNVGIFDNQANLIANNFSAKSINHESKRSNNKGGAYEKEILFITWLKTWLAFSATCCPETSQRLIPVAANTVSKRRTPGLSVRPNKMFPKARIWRSQGRDYSTQVSKRTWPRYYGNELN